MNDFTRTELASIFDAFNYIENDPAWRNSEGWDDELKAKISSMIDNYPESCKHNWMNMEYKYLQCEHCFQRKGFYE